MSFDYNAPAELFLAKPMKGSRTKYRRFALRLRPFATPSRICARPEPSALGCRLATSASIARKSNACTKTVSTRCASLSDRARAAVRETMRWPRCRAGAFSITIRTAPPHSPPKPMPCRGRCGNGRGDRLHLAHALPGIGVGGAGGAKEFSHTFAHIAAGLVGPADVRRDAEALARNELVRTAALRGARRRAYHAERPSGMPAPATLAELHVLQRNMGTGGRRTRRGKAAGASVREIPCGGRACAGRGSAGRSAG